MSHPELSPIEKSFLCNLYQEFLRRVSPSEREAGEKWFTCSLGYINNFYCSYYDIADYANPLIQCGLLKKYYCPSQDHVSITFTEEGLEMAAALLAEEE